jgi:hypothetical protein
MPAEIFAMPNLAAQAQEDERGRALEGMRSR